MKFTKAFSAGFITAAKSKKMTTLIYAVTLLFALILAIPFHSVLRNQIGSSMAPELLFKHFDYTVFSDFMRTSGKALNPFFGAAVWMGIFYLVFSVFFAGGVLNVISSPENKFSVKNFLEGCGVYFFRFLRLAVYMIFIYFILTAAAVMIISAVIALMYESGQNETALFYIFLTGAIIFALLLIVFLAIADYAKIILYRTESKKVIKSIWLSIKFVFRHFFGAYILYVLVLAALVLFFFLYFVLENSIGMSSALTVLMMFLVQQILIWLRTLVKIWFLGSELSYYDLNPKIIKAAADETPAAGEESEMPGIASPAQ